MIQSLMKLYRFAGIEQAYIKRSIIARFFYAFFYSLEYTAIYIFVHALCKEAVVSRTALITFLMLAVSMAGRVVMNNISQLAQTHAGYFLAAHKRIEIGEKLKRIPMGFFNENNLGEMTGIATTTLTLLETAGPMVMVLILSGLINTLVMLVFMFIFDWRIALTALIGIVIFLKTTSLLEKKSIRYAAERQKSETVMVDAVLEQIQGMGVVKSFNLTGKGDRKLRSALQYNCDSNTNIETALTPLLMIQGLVLKLFSVVIIVVALLLYFNGYQMLPNTIMSVIISFLIFSQIAPAGSTVAILRVVTSTIEQTERLDVVPEMDRSGQVLVPLDGSIRFEQVNFSYEKKPILKNMTLSIPGQTTTAIVGPSGSGKTTICNLISRFWDVDSGAIYIGGHDVRSYTLASLMDQITMVFQDVYLFADTIENNIKFGKPEATRAEVIEAAKKAACHDFIMTLPAGYDTLLGEGGATISGGEKQRISIARAMLKDAPIILLDEATANVDPENEDRLQRAIESLTVNKTIVMIAHRLKTVRHAAQIVVLDKGEIVQLGTHDELIQQPGIYQNFIREREIAASWTLKGEL